MNSLKKRLISLLLLTSMALSSFAGCSNNNKSSKKDSSESGSSQEEQTTDGSESEESTNAEKTTNEIIKNSPIEFVTDSNGDFLYFPVQSGEIGAVGGESNGNGLNLGGQDPDSIDVSPYIPSENGQPTSKPVDVTDAQGEKVTDSAGQPVTEYVSSNDNSEYKSLTNGNYVFWMDTSINEDFVFNDEFIKVTFEVKNGIPDGEYPITFATDFSSVKGVITNPSKIYSGSITVGGEAKNNEDHSGETDFIIYGDNVSCKQGESVDFYIRTKNNPGLAGTLLWFYYDSNAMTVKKNSVKPVGEFAEITSRVDTNTTVANKNQN